MMIEPYWNQERPSGRVIEAMWPELMITARPDHDIAVELVNAFETTHVNGGALSASFALLDHPVLHWFASRNRLDEIPFPERFLTSPAVIAALPDFCEGADGRAAFGFKGCSSLVLSGNIASTLAAGGAYRKYAGGSADAFAISERFRAGLFGARFDDVLVSISHKPWSNWFRGVAWDVTWLALDRREGTVSVLAVTDTD